MLVYALLTELAPTNSALARQAEAALAVSNCDCGCPSVDIVTDSRGSTSTSIADVDLVAHDPTRLLYAVLSVRNGCLTELDCVSQGAEAFFSPRLADVSGWAFTTEIVDEPTNQ